MPLNFRVFFKKDFLQYTGSFKERGARFALLSLTEVRVYFTNSLVNNLDNYYGQFLRKKRKKV